MIIDKTFLLCDDMPAALDLTKVVRANKEEILDDAYVVSVDLKEPKVQFLVEGKQKANLFLEFLNGCCGKMINLDEYRKERK